MRDAAARHEEQRDRERRHGPVADQQDIAALEPVSGVPGHEREACGGEKLSEADIGEIERAPGDGINLPPDGDALHLYAQDREQARRLEEVEVAVLEGGRPSDPFRCGAGRVAHRATARRFARFGGRASVPRHFAAPHRHG
jgi:hypothetical protein